MRFIGVDPSITGFASVILDSNGQVLKEISIKGKDLPDPLRMSTIVDEFMENIDKGETLFIERIWYSYSSDIVKLDYIRSIDNL